MTVSGWTVAPGKITIRSTRASVRAAIQRISSGTRVPRPCTCPDHRTAPHGVDRHADAFHGRHRRAQPREKQQQPPRGSAPRLPPSNQRRRCRRRATCGERLTSIPPPEGVNPGLPPGADDGARERGRAQVHGNDEVCRGGCEASLTGFRSRERRPDGTRPTPSALQRQRAWCCGRRRSSPGVSRRWPGRRRGTR